MAVQSHISLEELKRELIKTVHECVAKGPGWAQETIILREAAERLALESLDDQQRLLTSWHDLFRAGELSWGYDIDNPNAPFVHLASR